MIQILFRPEIELSLLGDESLEAGPGLCSSCLGLLR